MAIRTAPFTEAMIDGLPGGRMLDALVEQHVMGRKIKQVPGDVAVQDGEGKPLLQFPKEYVLEDYDPSVDGVKNQFIDPSRVFQYSKFDLGMARVFSKLEGADGLLTMKLEYVQTSQGERLGWEFTLRWTESRTNALRLVKALDPSPRLAVYKAALKAVLLEEPKGDGA